MWTLVDWFLVVASIMVIVIVVFSNAEDKIVARDDDIGSVDTLTAAETFRLNKRKVEEEILIDNRR